jgi:hypothetical protein
MKNKNPKEIPLTHHHDKGQKSMARDISSNKTKKTFFLNHDFDILQYNFPYTTCTPNFPFIVLNIHVQDNGNLFGTLISMV